MKCRAVRAEDKYEKGRDVLVLSIKGHTSTEKRWCREAKY